MIDREAKRQDVNTLVEEQRTRHLLLARENAIERAGRWAAGMLHDLKIFGDSDEGVYLRHFVFDSSDPATREHHRFVHAAFRDLVGIGFKELTDKRSSQATVGNAELYGWGNFDAQGVLQTATYEATRLGNGANMQPSVPQHLPIDLTSL